MIEFKNTFKSLRAIDVSKFIEKKGSLPYLSWTYAVDTLMQNDPMATWEFKEPISFGNTLMVNCEVTAFGKTIKMHLPVMDNRNNAVINPDSRKVSDAMMRCLVKAIACFGIGLYVYAGEDLPPEGDVGPENPYAFKNHQPSADDGAPHIETPYTFPAGSIKRLRPDEAVKNLGIEKCKVILSKINKMLSDGTQYSDASSSDMARMAIELSDAITRKEDIGA